MIIDMTVSSMEQKLTQEEKTKAAIIYTTIDTGRGFVDFYSDGGIREHNPMVYSFSNSDGVIWDNQMTLTFSCSVDYYFDNSHLLVD